MVDYREILRLQSLGHNITQIAGSLHSSRNTVREVERLADEKGIRWPLGEEVTNPQLYVLLYPERQEKANVYLEPDCAGSLLRSDILENLGRRHYDSPAYQLFKELLYDGGDPMEFRDYLVKVQKACKGEWPCWH